jgi:hypothetical protein
VGTNEEIQSLTEVRLYMEGSMVSISFLPRIKFARTHILIRLQTTGDFYQISFNPN